MQWNTLRDMMLAKAAALEQQAKAIRQAVATLGNIHESAAHLPRKRTYKGHTKSVCQYASCGKRFIGIRGQKFCSRRCGWLSRDRFRGKVAKDKTLVVKKPVTLLKGDQLSAH